LWGSFASGLTRWMAAAFPWLHSRSPTTPASPSTPPRGWRDADPSSMPRRPEYQ
jgi:hypothetical protein